MKKAYTLAEVLICVGIIGVLAAILLPLANKFKPDSNKAIYIKTYDAIVDIVKSMASNNNLYPIIDEEYNYIKAPLYNLVQVKIGGTAYGGDKAKFCQLFALNFPTVGTISCSKDAVTYSESSFDSPSFITSQGMGFIISTNTDLTTSYQTDIYFDINGNEKGNNCLYDAEKCKNPDRFKLIVSGDGHVIPADPMGIEYLKSKTNWRKSELTPDGALLTSVPDEWKVMPKLLSTVTATDNNDENSSSNSGIGSNRMLVDEGTMYGSFFESNNRNCIKYQVYLECPSNTELSLTPHHTLDSAYTCLDDHGSYSVPRLDLHHYHTKYKNMLYGGTLLNIVKDNDSISKKIEEIKKVANHNLENDYKRGFIDFNSCEAN